MDKWANAVSQSVWRLRAFRNSHSAWKEWERRRKDRVVEVGEDIWSDEEEDDDTSSDSSDGSPSSNEDRDDTDSNSSSTSSASPSLVERSSERPLTDCRWGTIELNGRLEDREVDELDCPKGNVSRGGTILTSLSRGSLSMDWESIPASPSSDGVSMASLENDSLSMDWELIVTPSSRAYNEDRNQMQEVFSSCDEDMSISEGLAEYDDGKPISGLCTPKSEKSNLALSFKSGSMEISCEEVTIEQCSDDMDLSFISAPSWVDIHSAEGSVTKSIAGSYELFVDACKIPVSSSRSLITDSCSFITPTAKSHQMRGALKKDRKAKLECFEGGEFLSLKIREAACKFLKGDSWSMLFSETHAFNERKKSPGSLGLKNDSAEAGAFWDWVWLGDARIGDLTDSDMFRIEDKFAQTQSCQGFEIRGRLFSVIWRKIGNARFQAEREKVPNPALER